MDMDNEFDKRLEINKGMPYEFRAALVDATDTLDFCWSAVKSVFGDQARPEHAIAFCNTVLKLRLSNNAAADHAPPHSPGCKADEPY